MIKTLVIMTYVAYKTWWKYIHCEIVVSWLEFLENI